jgi:uncharacterized protein
MDIQKIIAEELQIKPSQSEAVIGLIDEGNTIPFIARYRKEATGGLDDEQLRNFDERLKYLRNLEERKATVIASIEEQGKMTEALMDKINKAMTSVALEDLYRPYKPKRRTRAMIAREKGLEGLAEYLLSDNTPVPPAEEALKYVDEEKDVKTAAKALSMAKDIIAGDISDNADYRTWIRERTFEEGRLVSAAKDPAEKSVYENYYDYDEPVKSVPGHRVLALNRGEKEKFLSVRIEAPTESILGYLGKQIGCGSNPVTEACLSEAAADAYKRLIAPSIETEIRNLLTERAEEGAMKVFRNNLEQLLLQPPIRGNVVLGWDPAFRTGCKLAVVDEIGKVLDTEVIFPTEPQKKIEEAKKTLQKLIDKYGVSIISVGNGTACRESEQVIAEFIRENQLPVKYVIVSEAGASVYSASKLATEEYPDLDVGQRSAASIAKRLQDPLAELVKIDPKSIGVGQYQHDMNQKKLGETLSAVVEDCVNKVGVDVNTASPSLLEYVSGVSAAVAKNIVKYREENGPFRNRGELLNVNKLGPKAFEQSAGFLRIPGGEEVLDMTAVHPESYEAARGLLRELGYSEEDVRNGSTKDIVLKVKPELGGKPSEAANSANKKKDTAQDIPAVPAGKRELHSLKDLAELNRAMKRNARRTAQKNNARNWKKKPAPAPTAEMLAADDPAVIRLAGSTGLGEYTLKDILAELEKPGRDPRDTVQGPVLRSDVLNMKDLKPGMILKGTVRNIVDFGAFVDIGVHQDGLVHISELAERYIAHPLDVVSVGDVVDVRVMSVDEKRKKISLSMRKEIKKS